MKIRTARAEDFPQILRLARRFGVDYPGMEKDRVWVAEEGRRIVGFAGLKKHGNFEELVSLGVDPDFRRKGIANTLVRVLLKNASGNIYLTTIIPGFFERCGFEKAAAAPAALKKDDAWCEGCPKELCTVMVRKSR
jgi:N-acetylglutamate synthase-like GNAT family acetyltransferase